MLMRKVSKLISVSIIALACYGIPWPARSAHLNIGTFIFVCLIVLLSRTKCEEHNLFLLLRVQFVRQDKITAHTKVQFSNKESTRL